MSSRFSLFVWLIIVAASFGCSDSSNSAGKPSPSATPTLEDPKTLAARREMEFQDSGGDGIGLTAEARGAVAEFVKQRLAGWTVKGLSSNWYPENNAFFIDADLEREAQHVVVTFDVRKFFPDAGESYWLAVPVNRFRMERLRVFLEADLRRKLRESQHELDEMRNEKEAAEEAAAQDNAPEDPY